MISGIFQGLSFLTIFASTVFDALQYYKTENVYILASFISLILTSFTFMCFRNKKDLSKVVDEEEDEEEDEEDTNNNFIRNLFVVPLTMLILVFKSMALNNASDRLYMTISVWLYIIGSFTTHYMREEKYQTQEKEIKEIFVIFIKGVILSVAFGIARWTFNDHTPYESYMKIIVSIGLGLYAWTEIVIFGLNYFCMKQCYPEYVINLIKPLHLLSASISLSFCAFFYKDNIIPVVCVFLVIYLKHFIK